MASIDWLGLVVLSVIWGSSFLFVELVIDHVAPFTIVFFRVGLAALALILFCWAKGVRVPLSGTRILQYLVMGFIAHALPFTLFTWGQTHITAGLASIYNATTPLFTVLVAHLCLADERANTSKFLGVLAGFFGVSVLLGDGMEGLTHDNLLGQLAALGSAICYALCAVYGHRFSGLPPAGIAAATLTAASLMMAPLAFLSSEATISLPSSSAIFAILTLALLCTAVAYIIYYWMMARVGATRLMLVTFLIPASAILLGVIFLGETLALNHVMGLALIFCGLLLVDGQVPRFFLRKCTSRT
ncbi:MAG: DMT family transporter [Gammaproteobacteria bacterium]